MAMVVKSSFSSGELDPALHERTTLQKYKTGLKTARNVIVTKTGSLMSRPARKYFITTKNAGEQVKGYSPPDSGYFLEWGNLYVRIFTFDDNGAPTLLFTTAHALTEADLPYIHFDTSQQYVYVFRTGHQPLKLNYVTGAFVGTTLFDIPAAPTNGSQTDGTTVPTGYDVEYAVTYMKSGQESNFLTITAGKMPIAAAQSSTIDFRVATTADASITEARIYRRPRAAGAYGLIGSTTAFHTPSGTNKHAKFEDIGQSADYSHGPPSTIIAEQTAPIDLNSKTGTVYQQRLLLTSTADLEAIFASRPGFQNNFFRDYPLSSDSALKFKAGTSGYARVRRMIDSDGLVVFTSAGVFLHTGALTPDNLTLARKGKWKIKEDVAPLPLPGGVFFVDESTNTIRTLVWSNELASYNGQEVSIYSNHLFAEKSVRSWGFQEGGFPLLWVGFDDGTFASFTYEFDQEMRAWTRHDCNRWYVEEIVGTDRADRTFFLMSSAPPGSTLAGTRRHWEVTIPRQIPAVDFTTDPEVGMKESIAAMDYTQSWYELLSDDLIDDALILDPVTPADEADGFVTGTMTLSCTDDAIFTNGAGEPGEVGQIFRWFDPDDQSIIDLEVISRASDNEVTVQPSAPYPTSSSFQTNNLLRPRLYKTRNVIENLSFSLGSQQLSIIVDGAVVASPFNDVDALSTVTPSGTDVTLPGGILGAIVHIGVPFIADVETLDIDTVEQQPALIESLTVNRIDVKVNHSRGVFIGHEFPDDDLVTGMQDIDDYLTEGGEDIIGNTYKHPDTKRVELTLPGDWSSQGRICLRQVDPLHFEILSLIPDLEIYRRSDR